MTTYTLTSYEPVALELPKPQVPDSLVDAQIAKMLEPLATYHEVAEDRGVLPGDFLVVTTHDPALDGNPAATSSWSTPSTTWAQERCPRPSTTSSSA